MSPAARSLLALGLSAVLAGCTVSTRAIVTTTSTSASASALPLAPAIGATTLLVTVPGLADPIGSVPSLSSRAASAASSASTAAPSPSAESATIPLWTSSPLSTIATVAPRSTAAAGSTAAASTVSQAAPAPVPATTAAAPLPVVSSTVGSPAGLSLSSAPSTVAVRVAGCTACTVVATRAGARPGLAAALVVRGQGQAALISVRADGSVAGIVNVTNGASFPTPVGGALPCDAAGRCAVVGLQTDGRAVASVWSLGTDGNWTAQSIPGGFVSSTGQAQSLDLDGDLGIAVQVSGTAGTLWQVWGPGDDGYAVVGCEPAAGAIDPAALVADSCPS